MLSSSPRAYGRLPSGYLIGTGFYIEASGSKVVIITLVLGDFSTFPQKDEEGEAKGRKAKLAPKRNDVLPVHLKT